MPVRVFAVLALAQAGLIVAQADLLARAIAGLDAGPLPWLALAVAGRAALAWGSGALARRSTVKAKAELRRGLLARSYDQRSGGGFVTLATKGLDALDPYLSGYLPQMMTAALVPPIVILRLGFADWSSALIIVVTLPLVPIFGALVGLHTRDATRTQWERMNRLGGHFRDVLAGLSTLRAFGRTEHQSGVVRTMAHDHRRATMSALRVAFLSALVLELVCSLSVALVAVPVGLRLLGGGLGLQVALVVLLLTPEAYLPLRALGTRFHAGAEGLAAAEQIFGILDADRSAAAVSGPAAPPARPAEIRLEDVTVRFPGADRPALDGVSLTVRAGERIAVIGPSGAGKSTLLHLLLGFVRPDSGRVLVDGADLASFDLAEWRRRLAWVPQAPHLFAASVTDNIRLGDPSADPELVRRAARAAHAEEFVQALPEGYDTPLGERGAGLSAGQRQRVALARAYLSDAPIVLLDEPTARLDLASEAAVTEAAIELLEGRTAILVAHRPALLAAADRVVRLRDGRLEDVPREAAV
ncbi:thiol reductant ABC exporter subunit CydD [Bailinhaonella thermotolerans]|uniref:Thiol reductant ABC exporter subunit CydD n=2 Tax=Bailinhaonella thermotolerans TaxID=1070861 RepID=A0A3A4B640_9ACTN|nr:thiol reductant ABC exporter subunit CydD [Bailinhaonella thermotolerans]